MDYKLSVSISNDFGRTESNAYQINFLRDLPRLKKVVRPELFFADYEPVDITIEGKDLYAGLILTVTQ